LLRLLGPITSSYHSIRSVPHMEERQNLAR